MLNFPRPVKAESKNTYILSFTYFGERKSAGVTTHSREITTTIKSWISPMFPMSCFPFYPCTEKKTRTKKINKEVPPPNLFFQGYEITWWSGWKVLSPPMCICFTPGALHDPRRLFGIIQLRGTTYTSETSNRPYVSFYIQHIALFLFSFLCSLVDVC